MRKRRLELAGTLFAIIVVAAIVFSVFFTSDAVKEEYGEQEKEFRAPSESEDAYLKTQVKKFMAGDAIRASDAPWISPDGEVDRKKLNYWLKKERITEEEFKAIIMAKTFIRRASSD
jgi:hypothetical protein